MHNVGWQWLNAYLYHIFVKCYLQILRWGEIYIIFLFCSLWRLASNDGSVEMGTPNIKILASMYYSLLKKSLSIIYLRIYLRYLSTYLSIHPSIHHLSTDTCMHMQLHNYFCLRECLQYLTSYSSSFSIEKRKKSGKDS